MFHSLKQMDSRAQLPNVRTFRGNDTYYLNLGKCKAVSRVQVSGQELPQMMNQMFPSPANAEMPIWVNVPMWVTERDANGDLYLLRSEQSNDGIWQKGKDDRPCLIHVTGEWEDEVAQEENPTKPAPGRKNV